MNPVIDVNIQSDVLNEINSKLDNMKILVEHQFDLVFWIGLASSILAIVASLIAIYLFGLKYFKILRKVAFYSFEVQHHAYKGVKFHAVIENKSLAAISISDIYLVFENTYSMPFAKYDEPFLLRPFESKKIESKYISYFTKDDKLVDDIETFCEKSFLLSVYDSSPKHSTIIAGKKVKYKKFYEFSPITTGSQTFNGINYDRRIKYALVFFDGKESKTLFIDSAGFIHDSVFSFNMLPKEIINKPKEITDFFKNTFRKDINFTLDKLNDRF